MATETAQTEAQATTNKAFIDENAKLKAENDALRIENDALKTTLQTLDLSGDAIDALPKDAARPTTFEFSGRVGNPFSIDGVGFGEKVGLVILNNRPVHTTRWKDTSIKGMVPFDFKPGPITVIVNGVKLVKHLSSGV